MSRKPPRLRVGDCARVVHPLRVVRVGYPKAAADFRDEAGGFSDRLVDWLKDQGIRDPRRAAAPPPRKRKPPAQTRMDFRQNHHVKGAAR